MNEQKKAATPEASVATKDTESRSDDTASVVFEQLMASNIGFRIDGDTLRASPRELLTDDLKALIRDHKREILDWLSWPRQCWTLREDGKSYVALVCPAQNLVELLEGCEPGSYAAPRKLPGSWAGGWAR